MEDESLPLLINGDAKKSKFYAGTVALKRENVGCIERRRRQREKSAYYKRLTELQELFEYDRQTLERPNVVVKQKRGTDRLLTRISLTMNVMLLLVNLFASITTGSLAILNTFVDSCVDITTSLVLTICLWLIHHTDYHQYPRGRERLELLGIILCSIIMVVSNVFLVLQSVTAIITGQIGPEVNAIIISVMLAGALLKTILMVICYRRGSPSSKVLAMDMRNDIATTIVAIICSTAGTVYWPYADPVGGIAICALIATSWFDYGLKHIPMLVGLQAESTHLSRILKIVIEHDHRIRYVSRATVLHTSMQSTVELDIVLDENLPLKEARDISHSLRRKLLKLDFIETVYIFCDYECGWI